MAVGRDFIVRLVFGYKRHTSQPLSGLGITRGWLHLQMANRRRLRLRWNGMAHATIGRVGTLLQLSVVFPIVVTADADSISRHDLRLCPHLNRCQDLGGQVAHFPLGLGRACRDDVRRRRVAGARRGCGTEGDAAITTAWRGGRCGHALARSTFAVTRKMAARPHGVRRDTLWFILYQALSSRTTHSD
jgi:hypothetical protein